MTELARAWHPGARFARVRASHSYGLVLALIGVAFVFMSVAPNSTWADSVLLLLQSMTLVTALWTSGVARTDSPLSLSFVALATLGYGDYTPAGSLGRTLSIVEALTGQLYLVTVIAVLVSRIQRRS